MRRILIINPITSKEFDNMTKEYLEKIKNPCTQIECVSVKKGPASIETFYDEAFAQPEILKIADRYKDKCDAIVVDCFADPGLYAIRELVNIPVIGPAQASMVVATMLGHKFAVISTMRNSGPWTELQAKAYGLSNRMAAAIGIDIPVLELSIDPKKTAGYIVKAAKEIIQHEGAEVIILGCTGMVSVAEMVKQELDVPLIEPLATALKVAEMMIDLKLRHSKLGLYMAPEKGKIVGY